MVSSSSMNYRHPQVLRQKHGIQTSTQSSESAWITDINHQHGYQYGLRQKDYLLAKQFLSLAFKVLILEKCPTWFVHKSPSFEFHPMFECEFYRFFVRVLTYQMPYQFLDHSTSLDRVFILLTWKTIAIWKHWTDSSLIHLPFQEPLRIPLGKENV